MREVLDFISANWFWIMVFGWMACSGVSSAIERQIKLRNKLEHLDRVKAMNLGLVGSTAGLTWPAAWVCVAVGAAVPIGSFLVCWLAAMTTHVPDAIWVAPVIVGSLAIGTARKLATQTFIPSSVATPSAVAWSNPAAKPEFDPDAFDVVGSRG